MKKVIVIKIRINLPYDERAVLEAKFRKQYEEGLIILPSYCEAFVAEIDGMETKP